MRVNLANVQGNVVPGFNTDFQCFLALRRVAGAEAADLRAWVRELAGLATSGHAVREQRNAMKDRFQAVGMTWLMVGFGYPLMQVLRPDAIFNSVAYRNGFFARRHDTMRDDTDPNYWVAGGPTTEIELLLLVAGNNEDSVQNEADMLESKSREFGFARTYRELGSRLPQDREHFGFHDGISQPKLALDDAADGLPPGQFLFGYPDMDFRIPSALFMNTPAALSTDGSMMVFRRLLQDISAFRAFCDAEARRLQTRWPNLRPEHLAALVVGRWPDGQLVSAQRPYPLSDSAGLDDFDFSDDTSGEQCPFTAHIRKVNPRRGGGDVTLPERHRFLRRGIPFGKLYDDAPEEPRGLLFVAFQTNIDGQVDFVTRAWMNSHDRPNEGNDLLVGRGFAPTPGVLTIKRNGSEYNVLATENKWVIPNGGEYLYVPSIAGMHTISRAPDGYIAWRLRRAAGITRNAAQSLATRSSQ